MQLANKTAEGSSHYETAQNLISTGVIDKGFFYLFLILFVAAVGLLASKDIGTVLKKYGVKFVILGFVITLLGAATTYGMTLLSDDASPYKVSGVYTGALTSSPGLAAAIETGRSHADEWTEKYQSESESEQQRFLNILDESGELKADEVDSLTATQKDQFIRNAEAGIGVGHAIGYPFGVLIVIIAVNFFPKIFKMDVDEEMKQYRKEMARDDENFDNGDGQFDLIAFIFACFFGYTLGKFKINLNFLGLGYFSLGSTGGVLVGLLILGYIGKIGFMNFRMDSKILGVVRKISLAFFLAIVGLRYGFKVFEAIAGAGAYLAVVALAVGVVAMLLGFFIGRYIFGINWIMLSGAICGGMTSTPGLGAAVDAIGSDEPAAGYGATYPFVLLGMVIFTIILHKMPM
jgi:putative transport protein